MQRLRPARLAAAVMIASCAACILQTAGEAPGETGAEDARDDGPGPEAPDEGRDRPDTDGADRADEAPEARDEGDRGDDGPGEEPGEAPDADDGEADAEAGPFCGNDVVDGAEICDGTALAGASCETLGFAGGTLGCAPDCAAYDTALCLACLDECPTEGGQRCRGTMQQLCTVGTDGCLVWADHHDCADDSQVCDDTTGAARCFGGSGDSCATPRAVTALPFTTGGGDITAAYHDDHAFAGRDCEAAAGVEGVFVVPLMAGQTVRLRETDRVNVMLRVLSTCADSAPCLADRDEPEDPGLSFTAPADGNYYFVVEATSATPGDKRYAITIEEAPGGDLCTDPLVAETLPVNVHGPNVTDHYTDDADFAGAGCSSAAGVDVFLSRELVRGETLRLSESGTADVTLRVVDSCAPAAPCLADRAAPEVPGLTFTAPADGTYVFVVELASATPGAVAYDILLEEAPGGEICTDPLPVVDLPTTVSGTNITLDYADDAAFPGRNCSSAAGADVYLSRRMAAGETVRLRERGTVDVVLRVLDSCAPTAECLADRTTPEDPGLTFTAPAEGDYLFVVEALHATPGAVAYEIVVDDPPAGNLCTDPLEVAGLPFDAQGPDFLEAYTDDVTFSGRGCTAAAGPEIILRRAMTAGETVRLDEAGTLDAVLRVLRACSPTAECLVSQDEPEDPGLSFAARADEVYYFVVESKSATPGARGWHVHLQAP